jgi:hypothetical protein
MLQIEELENRWVPTTITPTTFQDGSLGSGSLRDAVLHFNADAGTDDDTIQLLGGTYALTIKNTNGHENAGLEGDLNLTQTNHRWIIQGVGLTTVIDAIQLEDRVFQIVNPGTQVVFRDLVIQGGLAQDDGSEGAQAGTTDALGGGIFDNGGDFWLDRVILQNNVARGGDGAKHFSGHHAHGGGLFASGGSLRSCDSTIASNQAIGGNAVGINTPAPLGGDGAGGGIYSMGGLLSLANMSVSGNTVRGGEGGTGSLTPSGAGGAGLGGGIYADGGMLTLTTTTLSGNTASGGLGGPGSNVASGMGGQGGRGGSGAGAGIFATGGLVTLTNTTIAGNTLSGGSGGWGGHAGNGQDGYPGDGGPGDGGGLSLNAMAQVCFSTIANNQAMGGPATGGGVSNHGQLQTRDSLLVGNTTAGDGINSGPDVGGDLGSLGHNLVSNSQGGTGFDATDLLDVDPMLGPLQNNGGPTQTMALLPGSPAIDAGDNTGAPRFDQRGRGFHRIVNGIIDIGAFEVQSAGPGPAARREGLGAGPSLALPVSSLPLRTDSPASWSSARFPSQVTIPTETLNIAPRQAGQSGPNAVAVDRLLTAVHEDEQEQRATRWPDLELVDFVGSHRDLFPAEAGLVLVSLDSQHR